MKRLKHKNKRFNGIPIFIGMTVLVIGLGFWLLHPQNAAAAWFDTNWDYRKAITITISSSNASDITNLETLVTVDTSAISTKLQGSCQDLRFTSATGKLLPYYIDSGCTTTTTKVWVMVDLIPKNTTTYTMYMYYGNPSAIAGTDLVKFNSFRGLIGYWPMNETANSWANTSGEVKDYSVKANNGTGSGFGGTTSPTASGKYGNTGLFANASSQYVTAPYIASYSVTNAWTFSSWVSGDICNVTCGIMTYLGSSTNTSSFSRIAIKTGFSHGLIRYNITWSDTTTTNVSSTILVADNTFAHIVLTYDGANVKLYINGVLDSATAAAAKSVSIPGTDRFDIGHSFDNSAVPFDGKIDDVRFYNRTLSQADVTQLYNNPGNIATSLQKNANPSVSVASEEQAPGPTMYWKFDDGTGTSAKDSSSNANTGTLGGATIPTWQTEDQSISGKSLYFNGASSKVTGSKIALAIKTVAFWIRPDTIATQGIFNLDGGTHKISTNSSGVISATGFTSPTYYINGIPQTSPTLVLGQWNYVEITTGTSFDTTSSFTVGTDGTNFIKGFIDEVKFYQYARSASQVQADYNSRGSLVASGNTLGASTQNNINALNQGLVGYWKTDEAPGSTNAADSSGNAATGTYTSGATTAAGKFGNAGSFDGASGYITGSDSKLPSGTAARTVSVWFKLTALPTDGISFIPFVYGTAASNQAYALFINNTGGIYTVGSSISGTSIAKIFTPVIGTWYNLVATQTADGTVTVYVNGASLGTGSFTTTNTVLNSYFISRNVISSGFMPGLIDETRVYNRVLSPEDVQNLYNFAPGPVAYYNFEENTGSSVNDRSGNANTGTWAGTLGSQWRPGKYGSAGNFNGTNNQVNLADLTESSNGSVSLWFNPSTTITSSSSRQGLLSNATGSPHLLLSFNGFGSTGTLDFAVNDGSWHQASSTTTSWTANTWHYATGTWGANGVKLYVDGVLQGTNASTAGPSSNSAAWALGYDGGGFFSGQIDEARVYNYQLTQKQIISDMNAAHPNVGSAVGSAVAQWKFEEGADNKCSGGTNDACNSGNGGNALDLSQSGMSVPASGTSGWTNSGKFGKALVFDGSNDYLSVSSQAALNPTAAITVSAWVNPSAFHASLVDNVILSKYDDAASQRAYVLYFDSAGQIKFETSPSCTSTNTVTLSSGYTASTGTWIHIVAVYDGSNDIVYVNGIKRASTTGPTAICSSTAAFAVGARYGSGSAVRFFSGSIDEVKVYPYALTQDEVSLDYNRGSSEVLGALSNNSSYQLQANNQLYCVPGDATSCVAPVGEWNFDEGTGSSVTDSSGNGNTGTWNGTLGSQWISGKYNKAGNFNGSDNYVGLGTNISSLKFGAGSFTVSGWMKSSSSTDLGGILYAVNVTTNARYAIQKNGVGGVQGLAQDDSGASGLTVTDSSGKGNDGKWHYWTLVIDRTNSLMKLYADGVQSGNSVSISTLVGNISPQGEYRIGRNNGSSYFAGQVDQVRVFNYIRSAAQIAWDYNHAQPVGWWKMDDCQGTLANDSSGNNNPGTLTIGGSGTQSTYGTCTTSSTAWGNGVTGKINNSLNLDGNDDYVQTTSNVLNPSSGDFSASLWFKAGALPASSGIMEFLTQANGSGTGRDWLGMVNTAGVTTLYSNLGNTNTIGNKALASGTWYNFVLTKSGTTLNFYLNGNLDKTGTATVESATGVSVMGINKNLTSNVYNGQLDDVRIYNYQLTATQVQNIYNGSAAVRYGPVTGSP